MNFFELIKHLSNKNFIKNDAELIELSKFQNKKDIEETLINTNILEHNYKLNKLEIVKLYYLNRLSIHNILYNLEKIVIVNYNNAKEEENFAYFFYLTLLIRENDSVVNYSYSIEYIKKIINIFKKNINSNQYYDIIISKIIIELINNYKGLDEYEENENEIQIIEEENNKRLNYNNNILNKLNINLKDFNKKKIDEIYSKIIISLIKKNKFEDYEYTYKIIKTIDFESIDITNKIYEDINDLLNNNESIKNKYNIIKLEDLYDNKKINFYYILLKHIFKYSYYIYSIQYLLKVKYNIIKIINSNKEPFLSSKNLDKEQITKLKKFLELLLDSKYYLDKYNNSEKNKLNNNISNINLNRDLSINSKTTNINETSNKEILENKQNKEDNNKVMEKSSDKISEQSNTNNQNSLNYSKNESREYNSDLIISNQKDEKIVSKNISINSIIQFKNIIGTHKFSFKNKESTKSTADFVLEINHGNHIFLSGDINNSLIYYNSSFERIKEIRVSDWINNVSFSSKKNEPNLTILLCTKEKILTFNEKGEQREQIRHFEKDKIKKMNYLLGKDSNVYFCICEDKIIVYQDLLSKIISKKEYDILVGKTMKYIIQISENIFVIKSNKVKYKGKDELIFFNFSAKKIIEPKTNTSYSFSYTTNGLSIMSNEPKKENVSNIKNQILLCACKKYIKKQKNGILLVNMEILQDNLYLSKIFYNTGDFEVYCFCPLLSFNKNKIIEVNEKNDKKATEYFLVGGLDLKKGKGLIKLYKVNYGKEYFQNKIDFIEDIVILHNNEKYLIHGAISCIIQSSINGDIIASSWDGNVYLFDINLEYYLNYNKNQLYKGLINDRS